mmetsp:Transcript_18513/g.51536  ORF Transcript_18513/g.51536 Transcript_18513/m.51536 type:complete len:281 (+) Transcript_18513:2008-2850(+)
MACRCLRHPAHDASAEAAGRPRHGTRAAWCHRHGARAAWRHRHGTRTAWCLRNGATAARRPRDHAGAAGRPWDHVPDGWRGRDPVQHLGCAHHALHPEATRCAGGAHEEGRLHGRGWTARLCHCTTGMEQPTRGGRGEGATRCHHAPVGVHALHGIGRIVLLVGILRRLLYQVRLREILGPFQGGCGAMHRLHDVPQLILEPALLLPSQQDLVQESVRQEFPRRVALQRPLEEVTHMHRQVLFVLLQQDSICCIRNMSHDGVGGIDGRLFPRLVILGHQA